MKNVVPVLWLAGMAALPLAACNQTAPPAPASASIPPSGFQVPGGTGCQGELARYRAVMDNDLAMGHVNRSVHGRVAQELDQAAAACAAGRETDAMRMIRATKSRYGYG
jgi:hypothetical protein